MMCKWLIFIKIIVLLVGLTAANCTIASKGTVKPVDFAQAVDKDARVSYLLHVDQPEHHLGRVTIQFPRHPGAQLFVQLPTWRSGRYEILEFANGIRDFKATDKKGRLISWKKTNKSLWLVESGGKAVTVSYRVYGNDLGSRTRHIDDSHAFIDASSVFMYSPMFRASPLTVKLKVPRSWRSVSGMKSIGKHQFKADNYDILIDSPIETGIHQQHEFSVDDRQYELVIWGKGNYDIEKTIGDLSKLDAEAFKIWGDFPFSRYVYMIHATSGASGATEHLNSTIIQRQRDSFSKRKDYVSFISTAAHEFVHTWNVKAYRAQGLVPYDFQQENYTPLLWVAEGSTSYYDTLISRRAGILKQDEFHLDLARAIKGYLNRPGKQTQSVAESSFEKWIEATNDFTVNHGVNIYSQGALVSWFLDFEIRRVTDNNKSYDDVHKLLFQRFPAASTGFSDEQLLDLVNEVSGTDFSEFWKNYIHGTKDIDFDSVLEFVGLKIKRLPQEKQSIDLGVSFDDVLKVNRVTKGMSGWQAGLNKDDQIVAINDMRLTKENFDQKLDNFTAGEEVDIHFFRRDELRKVELVLQQNPNEKLEVVVIDEPSEQQRKRYKSWSGQSLIEDN